MSFVINTTRSLFRRLALASLHCSWQEALSRGDWATREAAIQTGLGHIQSLKRIPGVRAADLTLICLPDKSLELTDLERASEIRVVCALG